MKISEVRQANLRQLKALSADLWTALLAFADAEQEGLQFDNDDWRTSAIDMAMAIDKQIDALVQKQEQANER